MATLGDLGEIDGLVGLFSERWGTAQPTPWALKDPRKSPREVAPALLHDVHGVASLGCVPII